MCVPIVQIVPLEAWVQVSQTNMWFYVRNVIMCKLILLSRRVEGAVDTTTGKNKLIF